MNRMSQLMRNVVFLLYTIQLRDFVHSELSGFPEINACMKSLGAKENGNLSNSAFTSSSEVNNSYGASHGRLNASAAWIPENYSKINRLSPHYFQVDLGSLKTVTAVESQGLPKFYVKKFKFLSSVDKKSFDVYKENHEIKLLDSGEAPTFVKLRCPKYTRYIRFVPTEIHVGIAMKVEVYGCDKKLVAGPEPSISNMKIVSISQDRIILHWNVSKNYSSQELWCRPVTNSSGSIAKEYPAGQKTTFQEVLSGLQACTLYRVSIILKQGLCASTTQEQVIKTYPREPDSPLIVFSDGMKGFIQWKMPSRTNSFASDCKANVSGYLVQYRPSMMPEEYSNLTVNDSAETSIILYHLKPWTKYEIKLYSLSIHGRSINPASLELDVIGKAPQQPPTITLLQSTVPRSFYVRWRVPEEEKVPGMDLKFVVYYKEQTGSSWKQVIPDGKELNVTVSNLNAGKTYQVKVLMHKSIYNISSEMKNVLVKDKALPVTTAKPLGNKSLLPPKIIELSSISEGLLEIRYMVFRRKICESLQSFCCHGEPTCIARVSSHLNEDTVGRGCSVGLRSLGFSSKWLEDGVPEFVFLLRQTYNQVSSPPVAISSLESNKPNTALIKYKIPEEYYKSNQWQRLTIFWRTKALADVWHEKILFTIVDSLEVIKDLKNWTSYEFKVAAVVANVTVASEIRSVLVKGAAPGKPPGSVNAKGQRPNAIHVSWKPIPSEYVYGSIDAYRVYFRESSDSGSYSANRQDSGHDKTELTIDGLKPNTAYSIYVVGYTKLGISPRSNSIQVRTLPEPKPPTPKIVRAYPSSTYGIMVVWVAEVELGKYNEEFVLRVKDPHDKVRSKTLNSMMRQGEERREMRDYKMEMMKLQPFTLYRVTVQAIKRLEGGRVIKSSPSEEVSVRTKEGLPSAPRNVRAEHGVDNAILKWGKPEITNGIIKYYYIAVSENITGHNVIKKPNISNTSFSYAAKALRPYTKYTAEVRAMTVEYGPSSFLTFTTLEGVPTEPLDVTADDINSTHILVKWKRPREPNGIIRGYKVECNAVSVSHQRNCTIYIPGKEHREAVIPNAIPGVEYKIKVIAETKKGFGTKSKTTYISIERKRPKAPPDPTIDRHGIGPNSIIIHLKPVANDVGTFGGSLISSYQVIVEKLSSTREKRSTQLPDKINNYEKASAQGDKWYIAAELSAKDLPIQFELGNGKTYNGYYNAPLEPQTKYKVYLRAVSKERSGKRLYGEARFIKLPSTGRIVQKKRPDNTDWVIPIPVVAGVGGALLLLIVLVVIIILYLRRTGSVNRTRSRKRKEPYDIELAKLRTTVDPEQRPLSLTGDFPIHPDHPPVPMSNFAKHVTKLHKNDNGGFTSEYNQLEMGKEFSWDVAHLPENKPKNRYANIVAYDHARVILQRIQGLPGSDYINASYVDGFMKANTYVATQGPLPGTFNDFWRMSWELRSNVIIMLTNLQEKNKLKCHKYWPDESTEYGDIKVTLTRKEVYADYTIRTFLLEKENNQETREVKQFHFTVWPDHGVPQYATAILAFRRRVHSYYQADTGPVIVHCSAGVGRTGTYVAIDSVLDRISSQGDVDIFNFIAAMRTRRIAMVQTEEQYIFVHDAVLESVICGNTQIIAQDLRIIMKKLEQVNPESKMTGFEKEWKVLNSASPIPPKSACTVALLPENINKNRYKSSYILPADRNLVRLLPIDDDEATTYINAAYVDGYKQRNSFILAQAPLPSTVVDFWRMLCEHKSSAVVMLNSLDEGDDFAKFWPEASSREYEMVTVEWLAKSEGCDVGSNESLLKSSYCTNDELTVRQFRVTDSRNQDSSMMIKLFQYTGWTETRVPSKCKAIISLVSMLERWQQQTGNGPITVICSDGLGRSGTFATLNAVIERVKVEQVVDIFQAIKAMRIQRAHLVKHMDQYKFIHYAVQEYLTAFDDYANFK